MRKTLSSVAVVTAAGALLTAGGAYSVFSDAGSSIGGLTAGTVKLSVNGQVPATDIFALAGPCTTRYQNATSPTDALNMGTVNNTGCVSHFTVHNAGSLPFDLTGSTVSDTNPAGLTCVTSTITDGTRSSQALLPGADQVVNVSTATVNDAAGCQNLTDKATVNLVATEVIANRIPNGGFESGDLTGWTNSGQFPVSVESSDVHSGSHAAFLGEPLYAGWWENYGDYAMSRDVTVPSSGTSTLSYWVQEATTDSIYYDWENLTVQDLTAAGPAVTVVHELGWTNAWEHRTVDLTPYAGHTVHLTFSLHEDGFGDRTSQVLDDVTLLNS